jgi:hypothetical protein
MSTTKWSQLIPKPVRERLYALKVQMAIASASSDPTVRDRASRLRALQGAYQGSRCFIMGNGPSLNHMDLNLLAGEHVWGSNRCYLLFDRISWRPDFYVAVDKRVVPDNRDQIDLLPGQLPGTKFFYPLIFRTQHVLSSASNVYWYAEKSMRVDMDRLPEGTFTRDASKVVYGSFTVTVAALQLAVYLGFNPIYLIGCDTTYVKLSTVQVEGGNPEKLISTQDNDPNHFDGRYFGQGKKWHDPHVARMIFHYHEARQICDSLGVDVYNATLGGNLEEFPRVNYPDLFPKST